MGRLLKQSAAGGLLVAALILTSSMDREDRVAEEAIYCDMVSLYTDTNGSAGWPDYKGTYAEYCRD